MVHWARGYELYLSTVDKHPHSHILITIKNQGAHFFQKVVLSYMYLGMITEVEPLTLAFRGLSDEDGDETEIPDTLPDEDADSDIDDDELDDGFGSDAGDDKDAGTDAEF